MRMCEFVLFGGSPLSQAGFASGPRFGTPPAVCLQAMQRQVEVQRRIKQKVGSKEFEDTIQEWRVFWRAVWRFGALMADIGWAKKNKTPLCLLAWPKHTHTQVGWNKCPGGVELEKQLQSFGGRTCRPHLQAPDRRRYKRSLKGTLAWHPTVRWGWVSSGDLPRPSQD